MLCPDSQALSLIEIHDKKLQRVCSFRNSSGGKLSNKPEQGTLHVMGVRVLELALTAAAIGLVGATPAHESGQGSEFVLPAAALRLAHRHNSNYAPAISDIYFLAPTR
jgi:hypothetical protein